MNVYISNDNDIVVNGLSKQSDGSFINDAVLTATIYDASGNALANGSNLAVPYVASSNGNYRGTIPSTGGSAVAFTAGQTYRVHIAGSNYGFSTDLWFQPQNRIG
jgi:hypothetical protein